MYRHSWNSSPSILSYPKANRMIQRMQTLWMLLGTIAAALIWIVPIFGGQSADGAAWIFSIRENLLIMFLVSLAVMVPFINIFLFKSRSTQKKLVIVNMFLAAAILASEYFFVAAFKKEFGVVQGNWQLSAVLPFFILIFMAFAYRGIRHDEKLLSSADRMR